MVVCAGMFVLPSAAFAGVGASVTPGFPLSVTVGDQDVPASLTIQNATNGGDNAGTATASDITLTPSCGATTGVNRNMSANFDYDCPIGSEGSSGSSI